MSRARILVIANETVDGPVLHDVIWARAHAADADVLVVAPALNSRLRHWLSDEDGARRAAEHRLTGALDRLAAAGVRAEGVVGDADPLQALTDALAWFGADEVVISTHPEMRSHWLARKLVDRARARFDVPILHVVAAADMEHLNAA
jgi:GNAT superfamily N-acetyltransferase